MDKLEIIKLVEEKLPSRMLNGTVSYRGQAISFSSFLEQYFITAVTGNNIDEITKYIEENFAKLITYQEKIDDLPNTKEKQETQEINKEEFVDDFLSSSGFGVQEIRISENEYLNIREFLIKNMNSDGTIQIGPNKKDIESAYHNILDNAYIPPNLSEKMELCENMAKYLDEEILNSTVEGMEVSVFVYITEYLPKLMTDNMNVKIDGKEHTLDSIIQRIADNQRELIENDRIRKQEEKFNRTSENPNLLGEIMLALNEKRELEVTTSLPILDANLLTDEETNNFLTVEQEKNNQQYLANAFGNLKDAIRNAKNNKELANLKKEFQDLCAKNPSETLSPYVDALVTSIEDDLRIKNNNLIKIENNKEGIIDASFGLLNSLDKKDESIDSLQAALLKMNMTLIKWDIKDANLSGQSTLFNNNLEGKRIAASAIESIGQKVHKQVIDMIETELTLINNQIKELKA